MEDNNAEKLVFKKQASTMWILVSCGKVSNYSTTISFVDPYVQMNFGGCEHFLQIFACSVFNLLMAKN